MIRMLKSHASQFLVVVVLSQGHMKVSAHPTQERLDPLFHNNIIFCRIATGVGPCNSHA